MLFSLLSAAGSGPAYPANPVQAHLQKGYSLRQKWKLDESLGEYKKALKLDPYNLDALFELGLIYSWQHKYKDSLLAYQDILSIEPLNTAAYTEMGRVYSWDKNFDEAIKCYQKVVDLQPRNAVAHFNLGWTYFTKNEPDPMKAETEFLRAIKVDPYNVATYRGMGILYMDKGRFIEAVEMFKKAIDNDPNNTELYILLGASYSANKQFDRAMGEYRKAVSMDPKNTAYRMKIAQIQWSRNDNMKKRNYPAAIDTYQKVLAADPKNIQAHFELTQLYVQMKSFDKAIDLGKKTIALVPKDSAAYENLGEAYLYSSDYEQAISNFKKAQKLDPKNVKAYIQMGKAYNWSKQFDKALVEYKEAVKLDSKNITAKQGLEEVYSWLTGERSREVQNAPISFIQDQIGQSGLVRSFLTVDKSAYIYDQALAVIAFTAEKEYDIAGRILSVLSKLQNEDGSFSFSYDVNNGIIASKEKMAGSNAWVIMAVNYYTIHSKDRSYVGMAERCAHWLMSLQGNGPILGGLDQNGRRIKWAGTEFNLDAYSALKYLGELTKEEKYSAKAKEIKDWLEGSVWDERDGRFWRAGKDKAKSLDTNTWAILALGRKGDRGQDFSRGINWALKNCRTTSSYGSVNNIDGFSFEAYKIELFGKDFTLKWKNIVWFEGTEGVSAALRELNREILSSYFHGQTRRVLGLNGGVPYTTPDLAWNSNAAHGIASTAWYYFNEKGINPFRP